MTGLSEIGYNGYFTFEATRMLYPISNKRNFDKESKLLKAPIEIMDKAESLLYDIGKHILNTYDCFAK